MDKVKSELLPYSGQIFDQCCLDSRSLVSDAYAMLFEMPLEPFERAANIAYLLGSRLVALNCSRPFRAVEGEAIVKDFQRGDDAMEGMSRVVWICIRRFDEGEPIGRIEAEGASHADRCRSELAAQPRHGEGPAGGHDFDHVRGRRGISHRDEFVQ